MRKNASIISIHHLRIYEHHISFKKPGKGRVTWLHRKGNIGVEVKSITVQVKSGFPGIDVVSYQSTLGIKTNMLLIRPGLHLRIHPTHKPWNAKKHKVCQTLLCPAASLKFSWLIRSSQRWKPSQKKNYIYMGPRSTATEVEDRVYPHLTKARRLQKGIWNVHCSPNWLLN